MRLRGKIESCFPTSLNRPEFEEWLVKNDGLYFTAEYKVAGKHKCAKSRKQLGYYFAHLLPEITKQLIADGHTVTMNFKGLHKERPYDEGDTHELLTQLCGNVGVDGAFMRLSDDDMTLQRMIRFINNVLDFAVVNLSMNGDNLKAMKP